VIETASVIGLVFEQVAVEALVPDPLRPEIEAHLATMTQKQLVRPEQSDAPDYRFHHILIRDATYQGVLKRTRATLHARFADWAERVNRERDRELEFEEILGYHLEQAQHYLSELGPLDDNGVELGRRGSSKLAAAGKRAFARGDMAAAANLLRRAATLLPPGDPARISLLPDLGEAMMETGEFAWAEVFLEEAVEGAAALGDERLRAEAVLTRLLAGHRSASDLGAWRREVERVGDELMPMLEQLSAHAELAKAWRMVAFLHAPLCRWNAAAAAQRRALEHARLAGDTRLEARMLSAYSQSLCDGPTSVHEAIASCEEMVAGNLGHKQSEAIILNSLALLVGLDGDFDRARTLYRQARAMLEDLGASVLAASTSFMLGRVELLAGNPVAAEADLRRDYERLTAMGEVFLRPSIGIMLARALLAQERTEEAERLAVEAERLADEDDIEVQALSRSLKARALARRGELDKAVQLGREAVALIPGSEAPLMRTEALIDLAEVLAASGDAASARTALEEARDLSELKEMTVLLARVRALLDGLSREPAQPVA
jgi:predicted ATPase